MDHAILFGDGSIYPAGHVREGMFKGIHTWNDWHLIPASRPAVEPPEVYTNYVDLPGCHGKLDLSEYLTGGPVYKNRAGSFEFYPANGYGFWAERDNQIKNFLHGKKMKMVLDDEPEYFYTGRFKVSIWKSDGSTNWSSVQIDYELEPFKFLLPRNSLDHYWDRFLFEDIHQYDCMRQIPANKNRTFHIPGYDNGFMMDALIDDRSTFPASATVTLNGKSITVTRQDIDSKTVKTGMLDPVIYSDNTIQVSGNANTYVNLIFWGGSL